MHASVIRSLTGLLAYRLSCGIPAANFARMASRQQIRVTENAARHTDCADSLIYFGGDCHVVRAGG